MRGLKFVAVGLSDFEHLVAPHVGAWIEINSLIIIKSPLLVAPHVGAWIEIKLLSASGLSVIVAPHVGAWIEITLEYKIHLIG